MFARPLAVFGCLAVVLTTGLLHADVVGMALPLDWSIVTGVNPAETPFPFDNRGLALSADGSVMYCGYNSDARQVRAVGMPTDLTQPAVTAVPLLGSIAGIRGKAIAVDPAGRVYTTGLDGEAIGIYNADLSDPPGLSAFALTFDDVTDDPMMAEGIAVVREDGGPVAYVSDRNRGTLTRIRFTESGAIGSPGAPPALVSASTDWQLTVPGAQQLRGVYVDALDRIWVADSHADCVYRLSSDRQSWESTDLSPAGGSPYYMAPLGDVVLVTLGYRQAVAVLDGEDMTLLGTITPPWGRLGLANPYGPNSLAMLTGIATLPRGDGFLLGYEGGATLDGTLTDPVLMAFVVPEPASLGMLSLSVLWLCRRASRRRSAAP